MTALKKVAEQKQSESETSPDADMEQTIVTNGERLHHTKTVDKGANGQQNLTNDSTLECTADDDDLLKSNNASERILRNDRSASTGQNMTVGLGKIAPQAPRTLRSSSRHISSEDLRGGKVNVRNVRNGGNNEIYDEVVDEESPEVDENEGEVDGFAGELVSSASVNNGSSNRKRSYEGGESDSSEHGLVPEIDSTSSAATAGGDVASNSLVVTHKKFTKRVRRSSVLSMDLNEEDSRIEFDNTERTLRETANGNGGIAEA